MKKPLALIIMDGFGLRKETEGNAIAAAKHPNLDRLWATCPHTQIGASGLDVGLPDGQMGNSEVGHTNMGAGRIVYQELTRITKSIEEGEYLTNPALVHAMENAKNSLGLVLVLGALEHLHITLQLHADDGVGGALSAELLGLLGHTSDEGGAALALHDLAGVVLDLVGDGDLAAVLALLDDQGAQAAAAGVQTGSQAGRTGAQNDHVINLVHDTNASYL